MGRWSARCISFDCSVVHGARISGMCLELLLNRRGKLFGSHFDSFRLILFFSNTFFVLLFFVFVILFLSKCCVIGAWVEPREPKANNEIYFSIFQTCFILCVLISVFHFLFFFRKCCVLGAWVEPLRAKSKQRNLNIFIIAISIYSFLRQFFHNLN